MCKQAFFRLLMGICFMVGIMTQIACVSNPPASYEIKILPDSFAISGTTEVLNEFFVHYTAFVERDNPTVGSGVQGQPIFKESDVVDGVDVVWSSALSEYVLTGTSLLCPNTVHRLDLLDMTELMTIEDLDPKDVYIKLVFPKTSEISLDNQYTCWGKYPRIRVVDISDAGLDNGDCNEDKPGGDDRSPCSQDGALQVEKLEVEDLFHEFSEDELLRALADNRGQDEDSDTLLPFLNQIKLNACLALDRKVVSGFEVDDVPLPIKPVECIAFEEGGKNKQVFRYIPHPMIIPTDNGVSDIWMFYFIATEYFGTITATIKGSQAESNFAISL